MSKKLFRQRPLLSTPQLLALVVVIMGLIIALDLNRRARAGEAAGAGEASLQAEMAFEATRQVELQLTRDYVLSDDYVVEFARNEAGLILPGEKRVVTLPVAVTPAPTPFPTPTPDPAAAARPWQAWWALLTDAPPPSR